MKDAIYDLESEMAALGGIWLQENTVKAKRIAGSLETRDFYIPSHRKLFECFCDLLKRGTPLDMVTVPAWFDRPTPKGGMAETIESVGGIEYLFQILEACPSAANAAHYAETVSQLAFRRRLREVGQTYAKSIVTDTGEPGELYAKALSSLTECKPRGSDMVDLSDIKEYGKPVGVPTHLPSLNFISGCGGVPKGQMTIVAARKKVGKSSAMIAFAAWAASHGLKVGYYTIVDLFAPQIKQRLIQQETGWGEPPRTMDELVKYDQKVREIETVWDFSVRDLHSGASSYVEDLCVTIDADHDRKRFDLVCVDYAQKLRSRRCYERTPAQEIASSLMSELAAQCVFALVVGSQTNTQGQTSHSQEWENDCGLCVQFTRPDPQATPIEVDVTYNRFGPSRSFDATWSESRLRVNE